MLLKSLRCVLILAGAAALPLYGQQTTPANETMATKPPTTTTTTATKPIHGKKAKVDTVTTTTTTSTKTETTGKTTEKTKATHHRSTRHAMGSMARVHEYATRLASLLVDVQDKASLSPESWKKVANEALALANKLHAASMGSARKDATEARTHVREMHAAAMKGDADGAKSHAEMALPFVTKLIDWSMPAAKK